MPASRSIEVPGPFRPPPRGAEPEARLLLDLARGTEPDGPRQGSPVHSERFFALARRHQVAGLLHSVLEERPGRFDSLLPPELRARLRAEYLHHVVRNESLLRDMARVSEQLDRRDVPFLVFKGAWLAYSAYPGPGCRPVDDIDLGVRECDFPDVVAALREAGYRPSGSVPADPSEAVKQAHFRSQLRFGAHGRRPVELHFRMINVGPPTDEEWVWQSARRVELSGMQFRVPGPSAMLLHLVLHANQHGFSMLRHLYDVAFALRADSGSFDPREWRRLVEERHLGSSAYYALLLARDMCAAEVPPDELQALRPRPLRRFVFERAWRLRRVRELRCPPRVQELEAPFLFLMEMGSLRDKSRYLAELIERAGGLRVAVRKAWTARHAKSTG